MAALIFFGTAGLATTLLNSACPATSSAKSFTWSPTRAGSDSASVTSNSALA